MFYDLTLLLTAVIAGFMLAYSITLGAYFNYLLSHNMDQGFSNFYSKFRQDTWVVNLYQACLGLQFFLGLATLLLTSYPITVRSLAVIPLIVLLSCHRLTGFSKSEEEVNSGKPISDETKQNYLKWNLPLHYLYFCVYFISALVQLLLH